MNDNIIDQHKGIGLLRTSSLILDIDTEAVTPGNLDFTLSMAARVDFTDNFTVRVITVPASSYAVDWGDGDETIQSSSSALLHTYATAGEYQVTIYGLLAGGIHPWFDEGASANLITGVGATDNARFANIFTAFRECSNLASVSSSFELGGATILLSTWGSCAGLTSFPLIDFSQVTALLSGYFDGISWRSNDSLGVWENCTGLTSFPLINTSNITKFSSTWRNCNSLASFPLIDTSNSTNFGLTWYNCNSLNSFALIDTSKGTNFGSTWYNCNSLNSFPLIDTSNGTSFFSTWSNCNSLNSFPLINTSNGTNFSQTWDNCSSLSSFPLINTVMALTLAMPGGTALALLHSR